MGEPLQEQIGDCFAETGNEWKVCFEKVCVFKEDESENMVQRGLGRLSLHQESWSEGSCASPSVR